MIRIDLIQQNSNHPGRRMRHPSRASCEVAGRRYETVGPAPIYKIVTLLWLHGHGGEEFEVWDDCSPFGKPGGFTMRGGVRNWARLINGKPNFGRGASTEADFSPQDRDLVALAAGRVIELAETDSPAPGNGRTAAIHPSDGPECPQEQDRAPADVAAA